MDDFEPEEMAQQLYDSWVAEMRYAELMAEEEKERKAKIDNCPHPEDYVRGYSYHSDIAGDDTVMVCELCEGVVD